jgi:hypothetical protein
MQKQFTAALLKLIQNVKYLVIIFLGVTFSHWGCQSLNMNNTRFSIRSSYYDDGGSGTLLEFSKSTYSIIDWSQRAMTSTLSESGEYYTHGDTVVLIPRHRFSDTPQNLNVRRYILHDSNNEHFPGRQLSASASVSFLAAQDSNFVFIRGSPLTEISKEYYLAVIAPAVCH